MSLTIYSYIEESINKGSMLSLVLKVDDESDFEVLSTIICNWLNSCCIAVMKVDLSGMALKKMVSLNVKYVNGDSITLNFKKIK